MISEDSFIGLIKGYTADAAYDIIGAKLRATKFSPLIGYVSTMLIGLDKYYKKYNYKTTHNPCWRGMAA